MNFIIILLAFAYAANPALIYLPGVPVTPLTLVKAQVALNRWQTLLIDTYGTRRERSADIKAATDLVASELD